MCPRLAHRVQKSFLGKYKKPLKGVTFWKKYKNFFQCVLWKPVQIVQRFLITPDIPGLQNGKNLPN